MKSVYRLILSSLLIIGGIAASAGPIVYTTSGPNFNAQRSMQGQSRRALTVNATQVYSGSRYASKPTTVYTVAPLSVGNFPYYGGTAAFSVPKPVRNGQLGY